MIVLSMATMAERIYMLKQTLPTLLTQRKLPDKIMINVTTSLTEDEYDFYESLKEWDDRIEINYCNDVWRSCNKLLPALKKYPEADIITVDDDVRYESTIIEGLYNKHLEYPKSIISVETSPMKIEDEKIVITGEYSLGYDQFETFNRFFSRGTYFPAGTFEGTDIFDYTKMFELTNGTHDELWFWVNAVLKGITVIECPLSCNFDREVFSIRHKNGDYQLSYVNSNPDQNAKFNNKLNDLYGEKLKKIFKQNKIKCKVNDKNYRMIANSMFKLAIVYKGYSIEFINDNLSPSKNYYFIANLEEVKKYFNWFRPEFEPTIGYFYIYSNTRY